MSLLAFAIMILAMVLNEIEKYLGIPIEESPEPLSSHACKILKAIVQKKCFKSATPENESEGRKSEGLVFGYARCFARFLFHAMMCTLSGLLRFDGAGKEYVVPVAEKVVGWMPSSLEARVKGADGPITVMKKYLGIGDGSAEESDKTE